MSYEKTTWQNGDIITAEKLNKIEEGIANFPIMIVTLREEEDDWGDWYVYSDYSSEEICEAIYAGKFVITQYGGNWYVAHKVSTDSSNTSVCFSTGLIVAPNRYNFEVRTMNCDGHNITGIATSYVTRASQ